MSGGFTHEARVHAVERDEWYTPKWLFDAMGLTFDLDPCSPGAERVPWVPAKEHLTRADDGLVTPWPAAARAWVNPPYLDNDVWIDRVVEHCAASGTAVVLTFARIDTRWAQTLLQNATAVLFIRKRIKFIDANGEEGGHPGTGSMLSAFGNEERDALARMARAGHGSLMGLVA